MSAPLLLRRSPVDVRGVPHAARVGATRLLRSLVKLKGLHRLRSGGRVAPTHVVCGHIELTLCPSPSSAAGVVGGTAAPTRGVCWHIALLLLLTTACGTAPAGDPVQIGVPPGSSLSDVADSLQARGVLTSTRWFKLLGRIRGIDRQLHPGRFQLRPGASAGELLDQLVDADALQLRVTLPEGGTIWDLARNVESSLGIPADSVLAAARDSALRAEFGIDAPSVEGWLHPDTYFFGAFDSPREVVRRFLSARKERWPADWRARADAVDLDQDEVLNLASIVEAEAFLPAELPRIAAVYRNRLRIGMALQADPSIQYAFLLNRGKRESRLFNRDYAYQSPYNTYLHPGLPPTPIGNPSDAAIEAVLSPAPGRELYFVARGDGSHVFAESYQQHLRNIRAVRKD